MLASEGNHYALAANATQLRKTSVIMEYSDVICWTRSVTLTFQEEITFPYIFALKQIIMTIVSWTLTL